MPEFISNHTNIRDWLELSPTRKVGYGDIMAHITHSEYIHPQGIKQGTYIAGLAIHQSPALNHHL